MSHPQTTPAVSKSRDTPFFPSYFLFGQLVKRRAQITVGFFLLLLLDAGSRRTFFLSFLCDVEVTSRREGGLGWLSEGVLGSPGGPGGEGGSRCGFWELGCGRGGMRLRGGVMREREREREQGVWRGWIKVVGFAVHARHRTGG